MKIHLVGRRQSISMYRAEETAFNGCSFRLGDSRGYIIAKRKSRIIRLYKRSGYECIKHAKTNQIWIVAKEIENGWFCQIKDQGIGFTDENIQSSNGYGLQIIKDRARDMEWEFSIKRMDHETIIEIKKGGKVDAAFSNTDCR